MSLNILLVSGPAPFSTRDVWEGYYAALAALGHHVVPYPVFGVAPMLAPEVICADIVGRALDVRQAFDAAVFVDGLMFQNGLEWAPLTFTSHGLLTVLVPTDDPYEELPTNCYSLSFTNDLSLAGPDRPYLATAFDDAEIPAAVEQDIDLLFVGTVFDDRYPRIRDLARFCERSGISFQIAGHFMSYPKDLVGLKYVRVSQGTVGKRERRDLYSRSKIVLNLFRDSETAQSLNPRVYEVLGFGRSALLTNYRRELDLVAPGCAYTFDRDSGMYEALQEILENEQERKRRIALGVQLVGGNHTYKDRALSLVDTILSSDTSAPGGSGTFPAQPKVAWIFGSGRSGSTWLGEILSALPNVVLWNEPCFGWALSALAAHPRELDRADAFFSRELQPAWSNALWDMFNACANAKWPECDEEYLVAKEVNAPELASFIADICPRSRYIFLQRDPFDVLDSHLDMQQAGGWNEHFWESTARPDHLSRAEFFARLIRRSFDHAIAGFERMTPANRFRIRYEDLLGDTEGEVRKLCLWWGIDVTPDALNEAVSSAQFARFQGRTGRLAFRRYGRANVWRSSPNFTSETLDAAQRHLGDLRQRLGYGDGAGGE